MTHDTATRALLFAHGAAIAMGAFMVLTVVTGLYGGLNFAVDLIYLPLDGSQSITPGAAALLSAVSGGIMLGYGVLGWGVTKHVYAHDPQLGGRLLGAGILGWYISDCAGSLAGGAWFNIPLNSLFLALFLGPLLLNRARRSPRAA
ncbi:excinuclease ABC subunit A [Cognatishimia sp. SS12]|uniref:excinuclease ABC subunit A n=1 Tax=Cognatishimia sp. SS12 TaxID=2979465 RepID=UPI00232D7B23|nr:excinuclease ABC subunit A [Cognatishimia sp. SS12]MDC0737482.1 excinuclease ABC subunit A [Cognatishimia sp. SS12]